MIHLGQYLPGDTVVHRLDPRVKILSVVALSILIFAATPAEILLISVFLAAVVVAARMTPSQALGALRPVAVFMAMIFLVHLFFTEGRPILSLAPLPVRITQEGLVRGIYVTWQFAGLVLGAAVLTHDDVPLRSRRRDRAAPPAALPGGDPVAGPRRDDRNGAPFHADAPGGVRPDPDGADGAGRRFYDGKPCPCGRALLRRSPFRCSSPPSAAPTNSPWPWRHEVTGAAPGPRSGNWRFPAAIWAPSPSWPHFFS